MRKSALFAFGLVVLALVSLGLLVLSSASTANSVRLHHGDAYFFFRRQVMYCAAGVVIAVCAALFDYHRWRDQPWLAWLAYAGVLALLCAVFFFPAINGSKRWLSVGPLRLQPSEFAKAMIVVFLAAYLDRLGWKVELFRKGAIPSAIFIGVFALPIMLEPDFGSMLVVGTAGFLVAFSAGARFWKHLLPLMMVGGAVFVAKIATNANRMARIAAFFGITIPGTNVSDAAADRAAYQATQALAAFGNSGIWGVGLGESMQKHYYLPEAHTDFVFAVGAEELGIVFSVGVVLLFCAFYALSLYIARKASDRFGRVLVIGMSYIIFFQAIFNIGVVCKALPTKGMALPFFSYGGTNMLSAFFAVGTILSVGIHSYRERKRSFLRNAVMRNSH